ncbi:unnamed protein product [Thelazia callipaeda]|uniref:ARF7EP_C domain-containing protein n=1 Tax=Thelazia callipaeda TaxID=103827 RepID=A0A0N5CTL6_THECL|nr:unnamed protein product [Thelazia callipaeda]
MSGHEVCSGNLARMHRELKNLTFSNPGEATRISHKEVLSQKQGVRRSTRNRKTIAPVDCLLDYIPHHDEEGYFIKPDGYHVKLCDCLRIDCPGNCHVFHSR